MDIISEIEDKFREEIDCQLASNEPYLEALKDMHSFFKNNAPAEKEEQYNDLIGRLTAAVQHVSVQTGMKLGAKIVSNLLE